MPVASGASVTDVPLLNSAPADPGAFMSISDIVVTPAATEAIFEFSTSQETHVTLEYGLTREYDHMMTTESQIQHTETLGDLTPCARYYYAVRAENESQEGVFETQCPIVKKKIAKQPQVSSQKTLPVVQPAPTTMNNEAELVLNAAPEARVYEEVMTGEEAPEYPALPGPIAFGDDTRENESAPKQTVPAALLLFALLSGAVVVLATIKRKKKWYQR